MHQTWIGAALAVIVVGVAVGAHGSASAGETETVSLGAAEYQHSCASCHGAELKGDGPIAPFMKLGVPDLTTLSARHGGVFPVDRVYAIIDGRASIKGHGSREMPVWGSRFEDRAASALGGTTFDKQAARVLTQARILAVIDYIYKKQAK